MRERKSNAQKQFAYNKLKNEKQLTTLKHEQSKSATAPKRPPQPKHINVEKKDKEGMLIDLSSPQSQPLHETASAVTSNGVLFDCGSGGGGSDSALLPKMMNGMSILDTPIEVPTQGYMDDDTQHTVDYFTNEPNKLEPPPYTEPPNYMNTYAITKSDRKYASALSMGVTANHYGNLDPFDTSHIASGVAQSNNAMPTFAYTSESNASRLDSAFVQNSIHRSNHLDLVSSSSPTMQRNRPSATAELDEIVQNKIASLSPQRSQTPTQMPATAASTANSTLSDSLKVNLSLLTLNDTDDFENARSHASMAEQQQQQQPSNPKLDRAFLAELEKEIYKCDQSNVNMNNINAKNEDLTTSTATGGAAAPTVAAGTSSKETTVNAISSTFNWLKNDFANSSGSGSGDGGGGSQYAAQSPAKIYNNEPTTTKMTNYESTAAAHMTLSKKLYNTDVNTIEPNEYARSGDPSFKYAKTLNNVANDTHTIPTPNTYNTYAVYGSVAGGNIYDIVASSGNSDYYQIIQPNESQTVIYDEVAADDDLMRPHRPAPVPPPSSSGLPVLSAQQIQRRIERAQKGQSQQPQQLYDNLHSTYANGFGANPNQYIYEEIMQKNCNSDAIGSGSKATINAASSETMKQMKIEHLLR